MEQIRTARFLKDQKALRMSSRMDWKSQWTIPEEVAYLNHGSFGPSPRIVQEAAADWSRKLESQPMDFFLRQMEPALDAALEELAQFLGASRSQMVFVDNATVGMNIVAASLSLQEGDEVLLTDHEYGAVSRLWRRVCQQAGARVVIAELPLPLDDPLEVVDALFTRVTDATRLIVASHVTSATAVILPIEEICWRARERGIPVCVDGPHALAMVPVHLKKLDCDFYTASCHKWLSAPFGSGFLFVHPRQQKRLEPLIVSWGGSIGGFQPDWKDEFVWLGTRNPAAFLGVPAAIRFFQQPVASLVKSSSSAADGPAVSGGSAAGAPQQLVLDEFRQHAHRLIAKVTEGVTAITGLEPLVKDVSRWCGSMISLPLPRTAEPPKFGQRDPLQDALWERHRIEIPVPHWQGRRLIRVSAHLYNDEGHMQRLLDALPALLREFP